MTKSRQIRIALYNAISSAEWAGVRLYATIHELGNLMADLSDDDAAIFAIQTEGNFARITIKERKE